MCYICGGNRACGSVSSVGMSGGGGGKCVTSAVAAVPVGVCPLCEWVVVVVSSVLHLWWQPCYGHSNSFLGSAGVTLCV